jgi:hypothetical protein
MIQWGDGRTMGDSGSETRGQTDLEFLGEKILNRSDPEKLREAAPRSSNNPSRPIFLPGFQAFRKG